jgi:hypothetical protein
VAKSITIVKYDLSRILYVYTYPECPEGLPFIVPYYGRRLWYTKITDKEVCSQLGKPEYWVWSRRGSAVISLYLIPHSKHEHYTCVANDNDRFGRKILKIFIPVFCPNVLSLLFIPVSVIYSMTDKVLQPFKQQIIFCFI